MVSNSNVTHTIHVLLTDEPVRVWRPVLARKKGDDIYEILADQPLPQDEVWEFGPGSVVRVEKRIDDEGDDYLVAVAIA